MASIQAALGAAFLMPWLPAAAQSTLASDAEPAWAAMPASLLPMRLPVGATPGWVVRATAADVEAADATPVRAIEGDWQRYAPRGGRNVALQSARIELAATRRSWELAAVARSEILIEGSRDAFDIVHAYKQRQDPADGSMFAPRAHADGVVWAGLRGARSWALGAGTDPALQLTGALTLLSVRRVQQVDASGRVQFDTALGYAFDAQTLRQDSHRQFGGYGRRDATGSGYTVDLGLLWQPSADSFVNLSAVDVLSRLRVDGVSTEQATLSSTTDALDANGYLNYRPLVMGRDASATLDFRLSRKWSASAGSRVAGWGGEMLAGARWERVGAVDLPALWAVVPLAPGWRLQIDGELRFRSIGVGLKTRHASVLLRTQSLTVSRSHALGWQVEFSLPL
ncbi:MAG TPA: hypothetical protein VKI18_06150 [Albitalea sp.]|nr:hypothetical protein [Albitalea sp.]